MWRPLNGAKKYLTCSPLNQELGSSQPIVRVSVKQPSQKGWEGAVSGEQPVGQAESDTGFLLKKRADRRAVTVYIQVHW